MDKKISQLDPAAALDGTELLAVVQSGSTLKSAVSTVKTYLDGYYVPLARTLTINGTSYDLTANRTWNIDTLPAQAGNNGKFLTTDGSTASWGTITQPVWGSITGTLSNQTDLITYVDTNLFKKGGNTFGANVELGTNDAYSLAFRTNNTARISISSTGETGIMVAPSTDARLTIGNGSTTRASLRLMSGSLLTTPIGGAIENDGTNLYYTDNTPTRYALLTTATGVTGSGTTNYVPKWTSSNVLGNSLIFDNGTNVGINQSSPSAKAHIVGSTPDSTTYALKVDNSISSALLYVRNDNTVTIASSAPVSTAALKVKGRLIVSTQEVTANDNYIFMCEVGVGNGVLFSDGTNGATGNNQLGRIFGDGGLQIYGRNNASATKFELNAKSSANRMVLTSDDANDIFTFRPTGVLQHTQVVGNDGFNIIKSTLGTATNAVYSALSVINADATTNRLSIIGFTAVENTARHAFIGARYIDGSNGDLILGNKAAGTEAIRATIYSDGNFGINTSSAATARLHVVGTTSAAGAYALKIDNSSNSPLFCVQNDGTVGIGTISPVVKLQVEGLSYLNGGARITSVGIGGYWGGLANEILTLQATTGNPLILQYTEVGQIGIGTNAPNTSSILDIVSTNKGVLLPRMTTAQRDAISTPANGLQIYNTSTTSPNYYDGTTWQQVTNKAYVDGIVIDDQDYLLIYSFKSTYNY